MFKSKYKMYFHKIQDQNWSIDSYKKINDISELDDLLYLFSKIDNYMSGMFFIMRDDIKPIYEDKNNINGGVWKFKLSKKECNESWKNICYLLCNDEITKDKEKSNLITGISISPKINNVILKIWVRKATKINFIKDNIDKLTIKEARYDSHLRNI